MHSFSRPYYVQVYHVLFSLLILVGSFRGLFLFLFLSLNGFLKALEAQDLLSKYPNIQTLSDLSRLKSITHGVLSRHSPPPPLFLLEQHSTVEANNSTPLQV